MSNSKNSNLEDVSKGNDESAPGASDSTSNKKTRFTKSKSISEVFKELEIEDNEENVEFSDKLDYTSEEEIIPIHDDSEEEMDIEYVDDINDDSEDDFDDYEDEIIPIHNEYRDLDKSDALAEDSVEGGVIINPDSDDLTKTNVEESTETLEFKVDSEEDTDSIGGEADLDEFSESVSVSTEFDKSSESMEEVEDMDDEDFVNSQDSDDVLTDKDADKKIGKSSAQGVLINDKDKTSDSKLSIDIFNTSTIISIVGFLVGLLILLIGITYYSTSSERVVDNVLSGETAGLAIFLIIIGLLIIGFAILKFLSSSRSSLIIDTLNSIKSIDYDDISEDVISRDDFDAIFSIFKRKKDSNFSDNDKSVDSSNDLFEKDSDDEVSDDDIDKFYSDSNLTSQKNQSSFKKHENANSTEVPEDYDDGSEDIIPIHSEINEQSDESLDDDFEEESFEDDFEEESFEEDYDSEPTLEDKYSKYDFEEDSEDDYILVEDEPTEDYEEVSQEDFDLVEDSREDYSDDSQTPEEEYEEPIEYDSFEEDTVEDAGSDLEVENDALDDKYSKYDFEDEDEEIVSKPKFKKAVDLSKFEKQELSEEELAEKQRKAEELAEKKRRIIEGTNFDNSLRKD